MLGDGEDGEGAGREFTIKPAGGGFADLGLLAEHDDGKIMQSRVMADDHDAAYGLRNTLQHLQDGRRRGKVEPVHRLDEGRVLPRFERLQRLQRAAGRRDQHDVGGQPVRADSGTHGGGSGLALGVQRARMVGLLRIIAWPRWRGLGVAHEHELAQGHSVVSQGGWAVVEPFERAGGSGEIRQAFFFEKKNQKTFACGGGPVWARG